MKLYIIRHAPAEDRSQFALTNQPDSLRPLTEKGRQRMMDVFKFFKKQESKIDMVLSSPFTRCQQTSDICKEFYPEANFISSENLTPDFLAEDLLNEIQSYGAESIAIIGHEPDLGQFISWLLFNQATNRFPMKKSGIAKMDLYEDGRTYLKWMLRPKMITNN